MDTSDTGVAVDEVVSAVQNVIRIASISGADEARDLRVTSIQLVLNAIATLTAGGGVDFRIPVLGMKLKFGGSVTRRDTHRIEITMVPPEMQQHEIRDGAVETVLLDAIETIRNVIGRATDGDDPFILKVGTVELCFAVTKEGSIALGFNGELKDEIFHTLQMVLELPQATGTTK